MIARDQLVVIGRINKPHGVCGEVNATLTVSPDVLRQLSCVVCEMEGIYVPFFVESTRSKGSTTALLTIDGVGDDARAATLTGKDLYALERDCDRLADEGDEEMLPASYFHGFTLTDNGSKVGKIKDVDDTTENVLFIVERDNGAVVQVPAAEQLVNTIDGRHRVIDMNLPDGLFEI